MRRERVTAEDCGFARGDREAPVRLLEDDILHVCGGSECEDTVRGRQAEKRKEGLGGCASEGCAESVYWRHRSLTDGAREVAVARGLDSDAVARHIADAGIRHPEHSCGQGRPRKLLSSCTKTLQEVSFCLSSTVAVALLNTKILFKSCLCTRELLGKTGKNESSEGKVEPIAAALLACPAARPSPTPCDSTVRHSPIRTRHC